MDGGRCNITCPQAYGAAGDKNSFREVKILSEKFTTTDDGQLGIRKSSTAFRLAELKKLSSRFWEINILSEKLTPTDDGRISIRKALLPFGWRS